MKGYSKAAQNQRINKTSVPTVKAPQSEHPKTRATGMSPSHAPIAKARHFSSQPEGRLPKRNFTKHFQKVPPEQFRRIAQADHSASNFPKERPSPAMHSGFALDKPWAGIKHPACDTRSAPCRLAIFKFPQPVQDMVLVCVSGEQRPWQDRGSPMQRFCHFTFRKHKSNRCLKTPWTILSNPLFLF